MSTALASPEGWRLPAERIGYPPDCDQNWLLTSTVAPVVNDLMASAVSSILPADGSGRPLPARLFTDGWLRAETNLGGPVVDFSNLGITSLVPGEVTHALCRNDREWYARQPLTTKVANVRLPDHLYFIVAGIEAQVSFNFTVSQRLPLGGPLHIANGAGNATLRGFLGMDVDGGAIGRCEGSLGVQPWSISQLHVFGVGFSDAFVRAAVGAVLPLLVGEIPELLCRGEASTVSARIVDETGRARAFGGLPELANAKLTPVLAPLRALDLVVGPDHLKRARRDRERLAQGQSYAAIIFALAEKRRVDGGYYPASARRVRQAACAAAVLGKALERLDPRRPRTAIVHNLGREELGILTHGKLWRLHRWRTPLDGLNNKNPLWSLPFARVMYFDTDHLPLLTGSAERIELRRASFEQAWSEPGELRALGEVNAKTGLLCFNGGLLLLRPAAASAARLEAASNMSARLVGTPPSQWGRRVAAFNQGAAVPFEGNLSRCSHPGGDQVPLNAAFQHNWAPLNLTSIDPYSCGWAVAGGGGDSGDQPARFSQLDAYHSFLNTLPLQLGASCNESAAAAGVAQPICKVLVGAVPVLAEPDSGGVLEMGRGQ
ncbi:hypothetical protein EMIHUDRAFT_233130 [Emiliania huxleyi CCMP1516]|uniref:Nucleotide-diphospho-sugar transferase domain-containing protein n=2 Tax=Emiliania huxleyi TaxID=2903 RepID=A0A0D3K3F3_EMIH1|nr:hypothetical protein EMIHUDRAFT_233130 [Emiliania huxleyi CCMP1516]EOD30288.1 hypothetical protein EMIHUDRAFT_233130 [Emiliania huxleyi CCMP1516]|eukprot:XP_005782717.1 hypothetical protein EMIHUDRAFT_233130 [Emiliania huxleyi CCMP1516]